MELELAEMPSAMNRWRMIPRLSWVLPKEGREISPPGPEEEPAPDGMKVISLTLPRDTAIPSHWRSTWKTIVITSGSVIVAREEKGQLTERGYGVGSANGQFVSIPSGTVHALRTKESGVQMIVSSPLGATIWEQSTGNIKA